MQGVFFFFLVTEYHGKTLYINMKGRDRRSHISLLLTVFTLAIIQATVIVYHCDRVRVDWGLGMYRNGSMHVTYVNGVTIGADTS